MQQLTIVKRWEDHDVALIFLSLPFPVIKYKFANDSY